MEIFEISIFLILHFLLVGPSFNHTSANFENKKKNFVGCPCSLPCYKLELFLNYLAFF